MVNSKRPTPASRPQQHDRVQRDQAFQIGRTKTDGSYGEYWPGVVDDVWAFNGVATDDQLTELALGTDLPTDNP